MATELGAVIGIGAHTEAVLKANGFKTAEDLAEATVEDLIKIPGFGPSRAGKVLAAVQQMLQASPAAAENPKKKAKKTKSSAQKKIKNKDKKQKKKKSKAEKKKAEKPKKKKEKKEKTEKKKKKGKKKK